MNQAFFTLSLGIGAMAIFDSYIDKDRSLLGESLNISLLDTLVAICASLIFITVRSPVYSVGFCPECKTYA